MNSKYEAVIGLEVHAQLLTETKIFCGCSSKFGNPANSNICPVCLGHPGVLPVLNQKVVEYTVRTGIATNCTINEQSIFARKNYFYPDLPKGYQISQYEEPICEFGHLDIELKDGTQKRLGITRIHMEEDAGKSIHDIGFETCVDVNRCGIPLMEIVSEPDMRSAEEAVLYLTKLRQIVQYIGVCDGNMDEGSFRCDANVSVRLKGAEKFGTRTEIKNMNSFKNVEKAIQYEIERQIELVEDGGQVVQETLLWDTDMNEAFSMRDKEEAHDYRYFPDPDLVPVVVSAKWKDEIEKTLPELPNKRKERFVTELLLPRYDAEILTQSKRVADYFEEVIKTAKDYKAASNWVMGDVLKTLNEQKIEISEFSITPQNLGKLINLISDGTISGKIAKEVFPEMLEGNKNPEVIIKEKNLVQISDTSEIEKIIDKILAGHSKEINEFLEGKDKVIGFFVGQAMRETKGKANPKLVNDILKEKLDRLKQEQH